MFEPMSKPALKPKRRRASLAAALHNNSRCPIGVAAMILIAVAGCGKKADLKNQTSELQKAFPASVNAAPAPAEQLAIGQPPTADANAYVSLALRAVSANDYRSGVLALQAAQKTRGVTADQLMT